MEEGVCEAAWAKVCPGRVPEMVVGGVVTTLDKVVAVGVADGAGVVVLGASRVVGGLAPTGLGGLGGRWLARVSRGRALVGSLYSRIKE